VSDSQDDPTPLEPPSGEPAFNAPGVSLALIALLAIAYGVQVYWLPEGAVSALALSGAALGEGRWWTLLTHIFLHGSVIHILMNAGAALAFGPAVAQHFGPGPRAGGAFLLYFLVCGVASGLGYLATTSDPSILVIGASGAVSGLWGGAARLLGRWRGLWGVFEGPVRAQIIVVIVFNVLIGVAGLVFDGVNIAWQAHIAGFLAGLLLMGVFTRLARTSYREER
jgi:membrane associated rhomboid family serine protease